MINEKQPDVTCYVPGTVSTPPKTQITSGQVITMIEIHPDLAPPNTRRWIRTRNDLATWAADANLKVGTKLIVAGHPYLSPVATRGPNHEEWLIEATQIAINLAATPND